MPKAKAPLLGGLPLFVALALLPSPVFAAATLADGFVYVPEIAGEVGCLPIDAGGPLTDVVTTALDEAGLDPDFAIVLTARALSCSSIYYSALANDVSGIGYGRSEPEEIFDLTPGRNLQGIAFLNDLPYWLEYPDEFRSAFLHEIGHRFLARVHAEVDGRDFDLTGRQGGHWSYFLDSDGSPVEGNEWTEGEDAVTATPEFPDHYSALDLYLMGALAPEEVPPFRLLDPSESAALDCDGRPLTSASPPQTCEPLELSGTWVSLTVDDVIAAEGPRSPAPGDARTTFEVAFVLFDPGNADFERDTCETLRRASADLLEHFHDATDGRLELVNAATGGHSCDDLPWARPPSSGCQLNPAPTSGRWATRGQLVWLAALVAPLLLRRRSGQRDRRAAG